MNKVLLVEDSKDAYLLIQHTLREAVRLEWASSLRDAYRLLEQNSYDLILLDVVLPDGDGFQLCSLLQAHPKWSEIPVIFTTARNTVSDRVLGFSVGAEDFVSKPFDPLELKARVDGKLKKRQRKLHLSDVVIVDDLEINKRSQRAILHQEGSRRELTLTPMEFRLLLLLASKPDTVHSREELLDAAWGTNVHVYSRSVDTHISKLRKKLGDRHACIESVHGTGYRFVAAKTQPIVTVESAAPSTGILSYGRVAN